MTKINNINSTITLIGPRSSGKTTYLAGMAYFPQRKLQTGKLIQCTVKAGTDQYSQRLEKDAKNLIINGLPFYPSTGIHRYFFLIDINSWGMREKIHLQVIDVAGEGLDYIETESSYYRQYLEDNLTDESNTFLIILGDWEPPENDFELSRTINTFKQIVGKKSNINVKKLRLGIVMNKCERGELWHSRQHPDIDIFNQYFTNTMTELKSFLDEFDIPQKNIEFFAMSTFGVLDKEDPRPNRKDIIKKSGIKTTKEEHISSLRNPNKWQPYGMLAPIYWLATGKKLPRSM